MGISRADLLEELIPALNEIFGAEFEDYKLDKVEAWLQDTYPILHGIWGWSWQSKEQDRPTLEELEKWLAEDHPEQYAVYELWRSTAELEGR